MPVTYGSEPKPLNSVSLDDEALAAIGRLVRSFADIEELLASLIMSLTNLTEGISQILLNQRGLSRRVDIARQLLRLKRDEGLIKRFDDIFQTERFKSLKRCRDAAAHGVLLGQDEDGNFAFLVDQINDLDENIVQSNVWMFSAENLKNLSRDAELFSILAARQLGLEQALKVFQPQALLPHPKARKPKTRGK